MSKQWKSLQKYITDENKDFITILFMPQEPVKKTILSNHIVKCYKESTDITTSL